MTYYKYTESKPEGSVGIATKSRRGSFGEHRWSKAFVHLIDRALSTGRRARGRMYARQRHVQSLSLEAGLVQADVSGSRPEPYVVSIRLKTLDDKIWSRVESALAQESRTLKQLLSGKLPDNLEQLFKDSGAELIPSSWRAFDVSCTCNDREKPCKHIAAAFYVTVEKMEREPSWLLALRGRSRERLQAHVRGQRNNEPVDTARGDAPLAKCLKTFWRAERELIQEAQRVLSDEPQPSSLLTLPPAPLSLNHTNLLEVLAPAYEAISQEARLLLVVRDEEDDDDDDDDNDTDNDSKDPKRAQNDANGVEDSADEDEDEDDTDDEDDAPKSAAPTTQERAPKNARTPSTKGAPNEAMRAAAKAAVRPKPPKRPTSPDSTSIDSLALTRQLLQNPSTLEADDYTSMTLLVGAIIRKLSKLGAIDFRGRVPTTAARVLCLERLYDVMDDSQRLDTFRAWCGRLEPVDLPKPLTDPSRLWHHKEALLDLLGDEDDETLDEFIVASWKYIMNAMGMRQFHRIIRAYVRRNTNT